MNECHHSASNFSEPNLSTPMNHRTIIAQANDLNCVPVFSGSLFGPYNTFLNQIGTHIWALSGGSNVSVVIAGHIWRGAQLQMRHINHSCCGPLYSKLLLSIPATLLIWCNTAQTIYNINTQSVAERPGVCVLEDFFCVVWGWWLSTNHWKTFYNSIWFASEPVRQWW